MTNLKFLFCPEALNVNLFFKSFLWKFVSLILGQNKCWKQKEKKQSQETNTNRGFKECKRWCVQLLSKSIVTDFPTYQ